MGLNFERDLSHQNKAVKAIVDVFENITLKERYNAMCNIEFDTRSKIIKQNIKSIQKENGINESDPIINKYFNLDIKMETGTGKTYTYTKTMFHLNKLYSINKFIVLVPSISIKLGTEQFLKSRSTRQHFKEQYGKEIALEVLNSQKTQRNKKESFPLEISNFVRASHMDKKIHVLLINTGMLNSKTMEKVFDDSSLFGHADTPLNLLSRVRPMVIIDEPHRYKRSGVSYNNLLKIEPQCIIRYGATFPKKSKKEIDYENLLYNLDAATAFNKDLVKGVVIHIPKFENKRDVKVTLSNLDGSKATFKMEEKNKEKIFYLSRKDSLSRVDSQFKNVYIENMNKSIVTLSNGVSLRKKESIHPSSFSNTYQQILIQKAIDEHFKKEKEYFERPSKIKPLTLFFIDDVLSYRKEESSDPYIKDIFERLLKEKILGILSSEEISDEYRSYLQESLVSLPETHGGYFSKDNFVRDDKIQNQVTEILQDKKKLLLYKDGSRWNVRRFIFSKWTLKEGWDNPNVFTICKLRSSGSEISKLQEVGRGLRLPVNDSLFRVKNEDFELNYIVDFTEKDFANQLVEEINNDVSHLNFKQLSEHQLSMLANEYNKTDDEMFDELRDNGFIDRQMNINEGKREQMLRLYPILQKGVKKNKVRNADVKNKKVVVKQKNYEEFKELWEKINRKVIIEYKIGTEQDIQDFLVETLNSAIIQEKDSIVLYEHKINTEEPFAEVQIASTSSYEYTERLPYNRFLEVVSKGTVIPYQTVHNALVIFNEEKKIRKDEFFTYKTAHNIVKVYNDKMSSILLDKLEYKKIDVSVHPTALTTIDGRLKKIAAHRLGKEYSNEKSPDKYLYEELFYDSNELDSIKESIESVIVYGKIPQSSIRIPVINGQTYSPDFAYVVENKNKEKTLHIVIESKNKEKEYLSQNEMNKIRLATKFFETINGSDIKVIFEEQMKGDTITGIINRSISNI